MNCKYYKQQKQVSYDNGVTWYDLSEYRTGSLYESGGTDCNQYTPIYRWVNTTDYMCSGTTKYAKMKKQVSYDNGMTYIDVVPAEYMAGSVIEYQSADCGYSPIPYEEQYLTFEALEERCDVVWYYNRCSTGYLSLSASTDGGNTRTSTTATSAWPGMPSRIAYLGPGEKVILKGDNLSYENVRFEHNAPCKVYGNIMSIFGYYRHLEDGKSI